MQKLLKEKGLDGALFIFPIDVYYYAGTRQNSTLWIPAEGEPMLLVRKSYSRAKEESPLADIRPFPSSKDFPALFGDHLKKIGFTFDVAPVQQLNYYSKLLPGREFIDISGPHRELRSVKSAFELEQLRLAGAQAVRFLPQSPSFFSAACARSTSPRRLNAACARPAAKATSACALTIRSCSWGWPFRPAPPVTASSTVPSPAAGCPVHRPTERRRELIRENEPILLDYSFVHDGYITDMARVFVFGPLDAELQRAFDLALEIQDALQKALKPGAVCEELFFMAAAMAEEAGFGKNFMGMPGEQAKFVGHGVGLELDELPVLAQGFNAPLQAGQTIAIEPKFVIPGKGAIGIENTFAVTADGGEKITDMPDPIVFL